jgi:hypothetical protein
MNIKKDDIVEYDSKKYRVIEIDEEDAVITGKSSTSSSITKNVYHFDVVNRRDLKQYIKDNYDDLNEYIVLEKQKDKDSKVVQERVKKEYLLTLINNIQLDKQIRIRKDRKILVTEIKDIVSTIKVPISELILIRSFVKKPKASRGIKIEELTNESLQDISLDGEDVREFTEKKLRETIKRKPSMKNIQMLSNENLNSFYKEESGISDTSMESFKKLSKEDRQQVLYQLRLRNINS